ncbi:histidine phosphatase family protein [Acidobacteriota bacterium]
MKNLTIIRHAKSSWSFPDLTDFERPLNKRGKKDAPLMGKVLAEAGLKPDIIISSSAERAKGTAVEIAEKTGYKPTKIIFEPAIYGAHVDTLLDIVRSIKDKHDHAFLFGHNPGFFDLALCLTLGPLERLVTCGVVRTKLDVDSWSQVVEGCGELIEYIYPRLYK